MSTQAFSRHTFYKEPDNRWYIHLPNYDGPKEDLEMVAGADTLLDIMSAMSDSVVLRMSEQPFEGATRLEMDNAPELNIGSGQYYVCDAYHMHVWLCDVTKFVFGYFPENIYVQRVSM